MRLERQTDGKTNLRDVIIWGTGVFRGYGSPEGGDRFNERELDQMVEAHNSIGKQLNPRFYAGHPLNPMLKMLARPKGDLVNLRRYGSSLYADILDVPESFAKQVLADKARLSPDMKVNHLDPKTGKTYPWVVTGLAALGAVQAANSSLPNLADQLNLNPDTHYAFAAGGVRSYANCGLRSFDMHPRRYPATSLAFRALQAALRYER